MNKLRWISFAVVVYYSIGLLLGNMISYYIPAMNWKGTAYYAAVWPGFVASGCFGEDGTILKLGVPSPPVPDWSFSF